MIDYNIDYNNVFVYAGLSEETKRVWWNWVSMIRSLGIVNTRMSSMPMGNGDIRFKVIFEFRKRPGGLSVPK